MKLMTPAPSSPTWGDSMAIPLTPLGPGGARAERTPAVATLMAHGADLAGGRLPGEAKHSVELAAVLTLPDLLRTLIQALHDRATPAGAAPVVLFHECSMLDAARAKAATPYDPLMLRSRLVRSYGDALQRTLELQVGAAGRTSRGTARPRPPSRGGRGFRLDPRRRGGESVRRVLTMCWYGAARHGSFPKDTEDGESLLRAFASRPHNTPRSIALLDGPSTLLAHTPVCRFRSHLTTTAGRPLWLKP